MTALLENLPDGLCVQLGLSGLPLYLPRTSVQIHIPAISLPPTANVGFLILGTRTFDPIQTFDIDRVQRQVSERTRRFGLWLTGKMSAKADLPMQDERWLLSHWKQL